jgi:hypothetical protein
MVRLPAQQREWLTAWWIAQPMVLQMVLSGGAWLVPLMARRWCR